MGNHEFCVDCGQSDYHSGQTCEEAYPEQYIAYQKQLREAEAKQKEARIKTVKLAKAIEKRFKVKLENYNEQDFSYIRIHFWEGAKAKL